LSKSIGIFVDAMATSIITISGTAAIRVKSRSKIKLPQTISNVSTKGENLRRRQTDFCKSSSPDFRRIDKFLDAFGKKNRADYQTNQNDGSRGICRRDSSK